MSNINSSIVSTIQNMISESNINDNNFYHEFQKKPLPLEKVKEIFQQYYYYIRTFPQILSGLAPRVDDELIRLNCSGRVILAT